MDKIKRLIRNSNYFRLFAGHSISELGTNISYIALMVKVYQLTGNPLNVGIMAMFQALPAAIFGLMSGRFVDRGNKKTIMIVSNVARGALIISILFINSVWALYLLVALIGMFNQFYNTAKLAFEPEIIKLEQVPEASSLRVIVQNISQIAGPALGGFLVSFYGLKTAFGVDMVSYFIGAALVALIFVSGLNVAKSEERNKSAVKDIIEGFSYIKRDRITKFIIIFQVIVTMIYVMQGPLIFGFVREVLNGGEVETGILFSVVGIGGLAAGIFTIIKSDQTTKIYTLIPALIFDGFILVLFSLCTRFAISAMLFSLLGIIGAYYSIVTTAILQINTPQDKRGRVFAVTATICSVLTPLAIAFATLISKMIGVQVFFIASGVFEVVGGIALLYYLKPIYSLRQSDCKIRII